MNLSNKKFQIVLFVLFSTLTLSACGKSEIGESCDKSGETTSECVVGAICTSKNNANTCLRICSAQTSFLDPPFGVAEWIAFSPEPDSKQSPEKNHDNLVVRFEVDLQITWNGWSELLKQMPSRSPIGLHPRLVPPRGCWLAEPQFSPSATALGF